MAYLKCVLTMSICLLTSFQLDVSLPECKALKIESDIPGNEEVPYEFTELGANITCLKQTKKPLNI